jgi:hypothetical protein
MFRRVKENFIFFHPAKHAPTGENLEAGLHRPYVIGSFQTDNKEAFRMQTSDICHTQGIRGFKVLSTHYEKDSCIVKIKAKEHLCPRCNSSKVNAYPVRERSIQGQKCGSKRFIIKVDVHRIHCTSCQSSSYERLPFLPYPKARITRSLARTILDYGRHLRLLAPWPTDQGGSGGLQQ